MSFRIIFFGLVGAALIYFVFGGPFLGPSLDFHANKQNLRDFIYDCPRNEVRLRFYNNRFKEFMNVRINLTTRAVGISGGMLQDGTWGYFWIPKVRQVFHTITFPLMTPPPPDFLTTEQLAQLKSTLSAMPPVEEGFSNLEWTHDECYLAFYQGENLRVDRFFPGHVPPQFEPVCLTFGFGPFFAAWNAGKMP